MKTSEILNKSADIIQERGWTQGDWGGEGQPVCLEGGMLAAMGSSLNRGEKIREFHKCPAYRAVRGYLFDAHRFPEYVYGRNMADYEGPGGVGVAEGVELWRFNDAEERTAEEVIEVLRAVAVIEEARERAEEKVEVPA